MPTDLKELGLELSDSDIRELAFKCSYEDTRTIGVFRLNMKDMERIYQIANGLVAGPVSSARTAAHQSIVGEAPRPHNLRPGVVVLRVEGTGDLPLGGGHGNPGPEVRRCGGREKGICQDPL